MLVRVEASDAALFECLSLGEPLYLASGEYYGVLAAIDSSPAEIALLEDGVFLLSLHNSPMLVLRAPQPLKMPCMIS